MIYGYARVSTDGQSVTAQVAELTNHGAGKVFREVASGAKTDRAQLRRVLDHHCELDPGPRIIRVQKAMSHPGRLQQNRWYRPVS